MPEVRRLAAAERDAALRTVVAAFRTDPLLRWWFPDDATYGPLATRFFGVLLDTRLEGGEVWVADDLGAVAMWIPPGGNLIGPEVAAARYSAVITGMPSPSAQRIAATDDAVDRLLPSDPHWYLGVLATRPERRGAGLATAVCAPVFAAADRSGLPIVLETSTAANVAYYTRRGFAVIHRVQLDGADAADAAHNAGGADAAHAADAAHNAGAADPAHGAGRSNAADRGALDVEPLTLRIMLRAPRLA